MRIGWTKKSVRGYKGECPCPADFQHKDGSGKKADCVNLDHYARVCTDPPFPRLLAEVLYLKALDNRPRYNTPGSLSVTMLTGCPLKLYLERNFDFVSDPLGDRFLLRGTMGHEGILERLRGTPGYIVELPLKLLLENDITLFGTPDIMEVVSPGVLLAKATGPTVVDLDDLKTQDVFAIDKKAKAEDADLLKNDFVRDNAFQINTYALMIEAILGFEVRNRTLQYWDGNLRARVLPVPRMDQEKLLQAITMKAHQVSEYLAQDTPKGIPRREYKRNDWNTGWNPASTSGIYYLYKEWASAAE